VSLTTLRNGKLTLTISSLGAEMQSIQDENGIERLWQGDPKFWKGRAPILFPIAGGLREDCYYLDGRRYEMPKHGYVRQIEWQLEKADENSATYLMREKAPGFPFDYALRVTYRLEDCRVIVTWQVENHDQRTFYFGMGAHEGYATPGGIENYEILFDEEETFSNHVLHGNLIDPVGQVMAKNTRRFPLKEEYFAVDALVFTDLKSRGVTLVSRTHDRRVRVDFPEHDVLMFWMKPGAEYICIEPWLNAPDTLDSDMQIERKKGCIRLEQGQSVQRHHFITIL